MNELNEDKSNSKLDDLLVLSAKRLSSEQKKKRVDLLSTILLSLSAVLSALCAYEASRWYSDMNVSLGEAAAIRAEAAEADRDAARGTLGDMMIFLEWTKAFRQKDSLMVVGIEDRFSENLKKAFSAWNNLQEKGAAGLLPKGTPLELPEYSPPLEEKSKLLTQQSDEKLLRAKKAAQIGDDFIFGVVIFSLSLFFGAICTKLDEHILQVSLLWAGILILFFGVFMIARLPWSITF